MYLNKKWLIYRTECTKVFVIEYLFYDKFKTSKFLKFDGLHDSDQVYCCNIGTLQFCVAVTFQIGQVAHHTHNSINQQQNKSVTQFDFSKAALLQQ